MSIPDKNIVSATLSRLNKDFVSVITDAWERLSRNPDKSVMNRRSQRTLTHNFMMINALERLGKIDGVYPIERDSYETAVFLVDKSVLVRFKKGNDQGLSRNIPTQAALAFNDPQEKLFDLPDVWRVDVVYTLNRFETQISDILVVARNGDDVLWSYSIYSGTADIAPVITINPLLPEPPSPDSNMKILGDKQRNSNLEEKENG
jgi:hypothetical protein